MEDKKIISDKKDLVDFLEHKVMSLSNLKAEIENNSDYDIKIEDLQNIMNSKVIPLLQCDEVKCVRKGDLRFNVKHASSNPVIEVDHVE
jgi:hypothetical protein